MVFRLLIIWSLPLSINVLYFCIIIKCMILCLNIVPKLCKLVRVPVSDIVYCRDVLVDASAISINKTNEIKVIKFLYNE